MELELSLSPPNQIRQPINKSSHACHHQCSNHVLRFPLVSWNQDEDNDEDQHDHRFVNGDYQPDLDSDRERLTGWPPVESWRKRFLEENRFEVAGLGFNGRVDDDEEEEEEGMNVDMMNNDNYNQELFVKVKMDGVGIARKINLNGFHSYQMLYNTLIHMFDKYVEMEEDCTSYKLMYQHQDGYWLLLGDIPWEMFVHTVKQIRIVRS